MVHVEEALENHDEKTFVIRLARNCVIGSFDVQGSCLGTWRSFHYLRMQVQMRMHTKIMRYVRFKDMCGVR
jgi:hypothetical protein